MAHREIRGRRASQKPGSLSALLGFRRLSLIWRSQNEQVDRTARNGSNGARFPFLSGGRVTGDVEGDPVVPGVRVMAVRAPARCPDVDLDVAAHDSPVRSLQYGVPEVRTRSVSGAPRVYDGVVHAVATGHGRAAWQPAPRRLEEALVSGEPGTRALIRPVGAF